ncbi:MAG TPA: alpha/beta fold hydrolase BchO [Gemmatirosa sp.]
MPNDPGAERADGGPRWADWRTRWPNAEASRFVEAAGFRWHVQIAGRGPALLLLHGAGGGTHSWLESLPRLAARYTVVACDLPGHAFTAAPSPERLSLPGMAADVAALLATLGVRPRLVAGHSAGAAVLLRMALDGALPDARALVGINAAVVPPPEVYRLLGGSWLHGLFTGLFTSPLVSRLTTQYATRAGAVEALLRSSGSRVPPRLVTCYEGLATSERHVRSTLTMMAQWEIAPLLQDVHRLRTPTVLLAGADDRWVPASAVRRVAAYIPGAAFELWPHQGHLMHEEIPDATTDRLLAVGAVHGVADDQAA